jgi:hypothetical protein
VAGSFAKSPQPDRQLPLPWFGFAGNSEMYPVCPVTNAAVGLPYWVRSHRAGRLRNAGLRYYTGDLGEPCIGSRTFAIAGIGGRQYQHQAWRPWQKS